MTIQTTTIGMVTNGVLTGTIPLMVTQETIGAAAAAAIGMVETGMVVIAAVETGMVVVAAVEVATVEALAANPILKTRRATR